jgi:Bardet-Biedl syndrome 9 protein
MSLFRAKTWWSTRVGTDEEFDTASLQVGFLETNADKANVVIGSLQGILRVLAPSGGDYTVEDLLVEQDLGEPILGLLLGRFVPAGEELVGIAVLHPRKLAVYTLDASAGTPSLSLAYSHTFQTNSGSFTACNMTSGPFGGDPSRDHILVQSMDGRVACYEQDAHSFTRRLLNCLVPGPIVYVARTDSFVTATSTLCLESYRYQVLAGAQDDPSGPVDGGAADVPVASASSPGRRASVTQRKMVATDWSVCLGEQVSVERRECEGGALPRRKRAGEGVGGARAQRERVLLRRKRASERAQRKRVLLLQKQARSCPSAAEAGKQGGCRGETPRTPPAAGELGMGGCFAQRPYLLTSPVR